MSIVIRPHPANFKVFERLDLDGLVMYPPGGALPQTFELRDEFASMLVHCMTTLGINTTAMSDALLADRPCISPVLSRYDRTQKNASHFKALSERGFLQLCDNIPAVVEIVSDLLGGVDETRQNRIRFRSWFARPDGLDKIAGETIAERALSMVKPEALFQFPEDGTIGIAPRLAEVRDDARSSAAYRHFVGMRETVYAMYDECGGRVESAYEWLDPSPLMVNGLRGWFGRMLDDPPEAYAATDQRHKESMKVIQGVLAGWDAEKVWLGEPNKLGQYGSEVGGEITNVAGLRLRAQLVTLYRSNVIRDLVKGKIRTLAIIGAGWGGLALALARRFPKGRFVIIDRPDALLRASVYLQSLAPTLSMATIVNEVADRLAETVLSSEVVFIPDYLANHLETVRIDSAVLDTIYGPGLSMDPLAGADLLVRLKAKQSLCFSDRPGLQKRLAERLNEDFGPFMPVLDRGKISARIEIAGGDADDVEPLLRLAYNLGGR